MREITLITSWDKRPPTMAATGLRLHWKLLARSLKETTKQRIRKRSKRSKGKEEKRLELGGVKDTIDRDVEATEVLFGKGEEGIAVGKGGVVVGFSVRVGG